MVVSGAARCSLASAACASRPPTRPTPIPTTTASTSDSPSEPPDSCPATTAPTATLYSTRAVASLNIPSPSSRVTSRPGSRSRRATAVAATGSGGETTAPSTNAGPQPRPMRCATTATMPAVTVVRPTARTRIGRAFSRKSRAVARWVAANSSGGSTTGRIRSGSMRSAGTPGTSGTSRPNIVSSTGNGTRHRSASGVRTTIPASRAATSRTVVTAAPPEGSARDRTTLRALESTRGALSWPDADAVRGWGLPSARGRGTVVGWSPHTAASPTSQGSGSGTRSATVTAGSPG